MTRRFHLCRRITDHGGLVAVIFVTLGFDPVSAQNGAISWGAVGISWVLSTVTTCILIGAAFGIRRCLKRKRDAKTIDSEDEGAAEDTEGVDTRNHDPATLNHQDIFTSLDKPTPGQLLSVSQQSAYLNAQNERGKQKRRSQGRTSHHEPRDWVQQWCEEQSRRMQEESNKKKTGVIPSTNAPEDHLSQYPAGLDLPKTEVKRTKRHDKDPVNHKPGVSAQKNLPTCDFQEESKPLLKPADREEKDGQQEASDVEVDKEMKGAEKETDDAQFQKVKAKSQQPTSKAAVDRVAEQLPVQMRKHLQENHKKSGLPYVGAKANILEFKRPPEESRPDEITHRQKVVEKDEDVTSSEEEEEEDEETEESSEEESSEEEVPNDAEKSTQPASVLQSYATKQSLAQNESPGDASAAAAVGLTKSASPIVESTPPRSISSHRIAQHSKPTLKIIPMPAEGISPPPGLLPLTASSHHQVTKSKRQVVTTTAASHIPKDKLSSKTPTKDRQKVTERKSDKTEKPTELDLKSKRSSAGSEIIFLAPELQGTSTPAMKPKSAFVDVSAARLSHDTADDDDDETTDTNGNHNGLLSDDGLHELAHAVCHEWRLLANSLNISADRQAWLVKNYSNSAEICAYEMLKSWRDKQIETKAVIRSTLCNALVAANRPELAERLIQEEMIGSSEKLDDKKLVSIV